MGVLSTSTERHLHCLNQLVYEVSQAQQSLSVEEIFRNLFATRSRPRRNWLGEYSLNLTFELLRAFSCQFLAQNDAWDGDFERFLKYFHPLHNLTMKETKKQAS